MLLSSAAYDLFSHYAAFAHTHGSENIRDCSCLAGLGTEHATNAEES